MVEVRWMKEQKITLMQNEEMQHLVCKVLRKQGVLLLGLGVGSLKGTVHSKS